MASLSLRLRSCARFGSPSGAGRAAGALLLLLALVSLPASSVSAADEPGASPPLMHANGWAAPDSVYRAYPSASDTPEPDSTASLRKPSQRLTVFGYYRFFGYGRNITDPYPGLDPFTRAYGVGDGYREPMLSVSVLGAPNGRSSFGTELFIFTPYDGGEFTENVLGLNLGLNFYGNFRTELGNFGIRAGGIHWYNLSPFTIGVYQVLDRFTIFDRTPWEGNDGIEKYQNYFATGQAAPGDLRWNFQAFQGLILNGFQLPGELSFDAFWGKTQPNGGLPNAASETDEEDGDTSGDVPSFDGFGGDAEILPSFITGGRLAKNFGPNHQIAYNGIYSYRNSFAEERSSSPDVATIPTERREYQVHTGTFTTTVGGVTLSGEMGASKYNSPEYTSPWGEALMARLATPASLTLLPLDVQVYQVGRHFFNENGEIATNNNPLIQVDDRCEVVSGAGSAGGLITQVNQLAHNRRGVNVNTEWGVEQARFKVGWGLAHELAATTNELSFLHRVNGLAVSRIYNPFPADAVCATQVGPYGRQFSFFRGVFERVRLTDVEPVTGLPTNRKYYHAVDLQAKFKAMALDRPLYLFYLGSFGSANRVARPVPMDDDTYLFVQSHEFDLYYQVLPSFIFTGYLGLEFAQGGQFTQVDTGFTLQEGAEETVFPASGLPLDQYGSGIGIGFDWLLAANAGLYVRHRWMHYEDRSFELATYTGQESTVELKIFF
ncbi:MAG: hypothetical protein AAF809_15210 [Bacteroidota bacterium]